MKLSVKWFLVATLILCFHLSLTLEAQRKLVALSAILIVAMLIPITVCKWRIADVDGWWKFEGSRFGRFAVWTYSIAWLNILIAIFRQSVHYWFRIG